jgi:aryl-alcohol dehydrogenase-like predicted oxidoreductase
LIDCFSTHEPTANRLNEREGQALKHYVRRAVELGVHFIDTADSYGPAVSERLIGEALSPFPRSLVVATKGGLTRQGPDRWLPVGRPEYLAQQVEMSLRFLKTEVIDLWQLHRIDLKVPVEESAYQLGIRTSALPAFSVVPAMQDVWAYPQVEKSDEQDIQ